MPSFLRTALLAGAIAFIASAPSSAEDSFNLDAYKGNVVVIDFWASWCVPCRRSFPWLNDMQAKYAEQGLVVVGVNLDANREDATAFLQEYPADFLIHFDNNAVLAKEYGVEAMPSSFVVGRDGEIIARHLGFKVKRQDEYEATLVEALGETP